MLIHTHAKPRVVRRMMMCAAYMFMLAQATIATRMRGFISKHAMSECSDASQTMSQS
jgi:hypothetical protein